LIKKLKKKHIKQLKQCPFKKEKNRREK